MTAISFEVINHVPPYKRIELGAKPKKPEPKWVPATDIYAGGLIWVPADVFPPPIEDIYCG